MIDDVRLVVQLLEQRPAIFLYRTGTYLIRI
jgi:hypothetical protein